MDIQKSLVPKLAQDPFPITSDGQAAGTARDVAQFQNRELDRRIHGDIDPQLGDDAVLEVLEHGVTKTVTNDIRCRATRGPGRWRPELARLLIANVKCLTGCVLDGIVAPRSEPEFMGVLKPGVSAAAFRNDRSERWIGQHIDPRSRSHLAGLESDDILVPVASKTAETILKDQLARGRRRGRPGPCRTAGRQCRN